MTYAQICGEYNTRMRTIDKFMEAVQENYIATIAEIRHDVMMNESFEDPYFLEAKAQKKIEEANTQVQEKGKQAGKGIVQTFLDFVAKLVDKVKNFFTAKKFDQVKEVVENSPEIKQRVVEGVVDEKLLRAVIEKRKKLAKDILREYEKRGASLTVEDLDDLVTQRQKQINEDLIKKRTKSTVGKMIGLVAALTASIADTGFFTAIIKGFDTVGRRAINAGNRDINIVEEPKIKNGKPVVDKNGDPVTKRKIKIGENKGDLVNRNSPIGVRKSMKGVAIAGAIGSGAIGTAVLVRAKKYVSELEKQNKLLESEELRALTLQISQSAMNERSGKSK